MISSKIASFKAASFAKTSARCSGNPLSLDRGMYGFAKLNSLSTSILNSSKESFNFLFVDIFKHISNWSPSLNWRVVSLYFSSYILMAPFSLLFIMGLSNSFINRSMAFDASSTLRLLILCFFVYLFFQNAVQMETPSANPENKNEMIGLKCFIKAKIFSNKSTHTLSSKVYQFLILGGFGV